MIIKSGGLYISYFAYHCSFLTKEISFTYPIRKVSISDESTSLMLIKI